MVRIGKKWWEREIRGKKSQMHLEESEDLSQGISEPDLKNKNVTV